MGAAGASGIDGHTKPVAGRGKTFEQFAANHLAGDVTFAPLAPAFHRLVQPLRRSENGNDFLAAGIPHGDNQGAVAADLMTAFDFRMIRRREGQVAFEQQPEKVHRLFHALVGVGKGFFEFGIRFPYNPAGAKCACL